jgi:hypothetical protein
MHGSAQRTGARCSLTPRLPSRIRPIRIHRPQPQPPFSSSGVVAVASSGKVTSVFLIHSLPPRRHINLHLNDVRAPWDSSEPEGFEWRARRCTDWQLVYTCFPCPGEISLCKSESYNYSEQTICAPFASFDLKLVRLSNWQSEELIANLKLTCWAIVDSLNKQWCGWLGVLLINWNFVPLKKQPAQYLFRCCSRVQWLKQ